jgi:hypothetical protein
MIPLKADQFLLEVLPGAYEPIEVYDVTGKKLLGIFIPANMERCKRVYEEAIARTDFEELKRREAEPGPYRTLREVIEELRVRYPINAPTELPHPESAGPAENSECVGPL